MALVALGAYKLADLAFAEADTVFRCRLTAALTAGRGPYAVAAIGYRRLTALGRACGFIDWEHIRAFAEDLRTTLAIITDDLGKAAPDATIERIVRFLGTTEDVFDRADDSNGHVQDVYYLAADATSALAARLTEKRKASLLLLPNTAN